VSASQKTLAAIALGSNLSSAFGSPEANLKEALRRLAALGEVQATSGFQRTAPVGNIDQPDFLNAATLLETALAPEALLLSLLEIEKQMGRDRTSSAPKGPRIIDLDLLLYGSRVIESTSLVLPHPAMHQRAFVLGPLAEIAPGMMHPVLLKTVSELLTELPQANG
jgi:2-amino-4-hydroxy-6-hydroxymethyldihydropteridine diphosphokinase